MWHNRLIRAHPRTSGSSKLEDQYFQTPLSDGDPNRTGNFPLKKSSAEKIRMIEMKNGSGAAVENQHSPFNRACDVKAGRHVRGR
jgi:hypothetical protein